MRWNEKPVLVMQNRSIFKTLLRSSCIPHPKGLSCRRNCSGCTGRFSLNSDQIVQNLDWFTVCVVCMYCCDYRTTFRLYRTARYIQGKNLYWNKVPSPFTLTGEKTTTPEKSGCSSWVSLGFLDWSRPPWWIWAPWWTWVPHAYAICALGAYLPISGCF